MNIIYMGGRTVGPSVAGISLRRYWRPGSVKLNGTCVASAKLLPSKDS